jgi:PKD repeat protein
VIRRSAPFRAPPLLCRRLGLIPRRRVAGVCLALLAAAPTAALADSGTPLVQATIYGAAGATTTETVSAAQLEAQCPPYTGGPIQEYGRQGEVTVTPGPEAWTVGSVLGCLPQPVGLADVQVVTIVGDEGSPLVATGSVLTPADLASPSDFENQDQNPVISANGSYDRPARSGTDLDFLDETQTDPIVMNVFEGPPLTVTATASQTTVTTGTTVDFSATVDGNAGGQLSYGWSFDGGAAPSTQPAPQIQFDTPGVWTVSVQVTDANGGAGGAQLTVTVGGPSTATTGTSTTGPTQSQGATPGGDAGSGRHRTPAARPPQAAAGGAIRTPRRRRPARRRSATSPAAAIHRSHRSATPPATATATTPPRSAATPAPAPTPTRTEVAAPPARPRRRRSRPAAPTHADRPAVRGPSAQRRVTGLLIGDVVPLPADESPLVHPIPAPSATAPARQAPPSASKLPVVAAVVAVMLLLGLGAGRELRGVRRRPLPGLGG